MPGVVAPSYSPVTEVEIGGSPGLGGQQCSLVGERPCLKGGGYVTPKVVLQPPTFECACFTHRETLICRHLCPGSVEFWPLGFASS